MSRNNIMRQFGVLALTAFLVLAFAGSASADKYVALGDSYSTGTMTGGSSLGGCGKSTNGYPYLASQQRANTQLTYVACDGAVTGDIPGQANSITSDTSFVSVTIGGNDVGFANLVMGCLTFYCQLAIYDTNNKIKNELPAKLDAAYAAIKSKSNAKVVVLGYARFFGSKTCTVGATADEQKQLNGVADNLDAAIKAAAGRAGFTYKSSISSFTNHDVCATDPWVSNSTWHPTKNGHSKGLLPALRSVIG